MSEWNDWQKQRGLRDNPDPPQQVEGEPCEKCGGQGRLSQAGYDSDVTRHCKACGGTGRVSGGEQRKHALAAALRGSHSKDDEFAALGVHDDLATIETSLTATLRELDEARQDYAELIALGAGSTQNHILAEKQRAEVAERKRNEAQFALAQQAMRADTAERERDALRKRPEKNRRRRTAEGRATEAEAEVERLEREAIAREAGYAELKEERDQAQARSQSFQTRVEELEGALKELVRLSGFGEDLLNDEWRSALKAAHSALAGQPEGERSSAQFDADFETIRRYGERQS